MNTYESVLVRSFNPETKSLNVRVTDTCEDGIINFSDISIRSTTKPYVMVGKTITVKRTNECTPDGTPIFSAKAYEEETLKVIKADFAEKMGDFCLLGQAENTPFMSWHKGFSDV